MDIELIKKAGLTDSQAKTYMTLIEHSDVSPAELAEYIGESRTNTYAIIDKMLKYGLICKKEDVKYGAKYNANHPSTLEVLAESRRKAIARNEKAVKDNISGLIDYFYKNKELPGARTLQGIDGIKTVYLQSLQAKDTIYLLRTTADVELGEWLVEHIAKRVEKGIKLKAFTPLTEHSKYNIKHNKDITMLMDRTLIPPELYTAPVEINVYENTVAFIAFGSSQMATIIQSPAIATCMRQMFDIMHVLLKNYSDETKQSILSPVQ